MSTPTDTLPESKNAPDSERKGGCSAMAGSASLKQKLTSVLIAAEGDDLIAVVETIIKQRDDARDLLDWAESLLCNALPMSHCTQDEWDSALKKWRDLKHGAPSEPSEPNATLSHEEGGKE